MKLCGPVQPASLSPDTGDDRGTTHGPGMATSTGVSHTDTGDDRGTTHGPGTTTSTGVSYTGTGMGVQHPLVYFTTSRGGLRAAWDPVNRRRSFKHFNNDLVDLGAVP